MSEEVDLLRAEVLALRTELRETEQARVTRRRLLTGLGAVGAGLVAATDPAGADDGDSLALGAQNTSSSSTALLHEATADEPAFDLRTTSSTALFATTDPTTPFGPASGPSRALLAVAGDSQSGISNAIEAVAPNGFAVQGENFLPGVPAIHGINTSTGPGLGAISVEHGPQLMLVREESAPAGHPTSYADAGSIRFDGAGDLWLCLAPGAPGSWTRLLREDTAAGRVIPITPARALDTRATGGRPTGSPEVPGQVKGPLKGGAAVTLDLAGAGPIPADARGVVGNLTVVKPTFAGFLVARPSGANTTTSAINFPANAAAIANNFTSKLGPTGLTIVASGTTSSSYHLVVDITAYIT